MKYTEAQLDKYRDINVEYDTYWSECVVDDFKSDMAEIGIDVDKCYWSVSYSQGDGAMFEGAVSDWGKFLKHCGYENAALVKHAEVYWSFSVTQHGHYNHENCTSFDSDLNLTEGDNPYGDPYDNEDDPLRAAAWHVHMYLKYAEPNHDFEAEFIKVFKGHMRDLYIKLVAEYEYQTSDEAVAETLEANDIDVSELADA